jgi:glycosyltransferase involved in cell wall biosynthesis
MIGRQVNAYVCFAWEEIEVPRDIIDQFNAHLDLVLVTSNFVEQSLRHSGLNIPVAVVGDGTDHVLDFDLGPDTRPADRTRKRILHVSSCFPRKGADLLVRAFTESFSHSDGVDLCIKTFENPHNTIERDVEAARLARPAAARIDVLKHSMSYPELVELMRSSDLLVAPSRGEGFGLPLAEAMLLDVPVVTTAFSGQTDFCNDDTAWMVDYTLVPSTAHVAKEGALWAEPDLAMLAAQMKRALADRPASRAKVARGQALLKAHFKWSDVARRVCQSLDQALDHAGAPDAATSAGTSAPALRVDLVSTWNQVCGIATYSEHLFATPALGPTLNRILARELRGDELPADGRAGVSRPWGYEAEGIRRLEASLATGQSDVVWFQHHPGFFSDEDMTRVTAALQRSSYRVKAITLHNVRDTIADKPATWLKRFDVIIVHTPKDAEMLAERGVSASVLPHGILERSAPPHRNTDSFTVGTFGFLYPHKNVPVLVEALALARRVEPRLRLTLLTCVRSNAVSHKERVRVEALVNALALEDAVDMDFSFLSDGEIIDRLSHCDLLCFPYGNSSESATGAARVALAADRPLLCSQSSVLGDILPLALVLPRVDAPVLADALLTLCASATICGLRDAERRAYVARQTYPAIAQRHLKLLSSRLRGTP